MNRSLLAFAVAAAAFAASSCTQAEPPRDATAPAATKAARLSSPSPSPDVEMTIAQLERDWVAAIVKNDTATIETLLADDFVGTSPTADTLTKQFALDDLKSGTYVVDSMVLDEISVNSYGDVAIAFSSQREKSRYQGKDTSGHYQFTDVWLKRDGQWRVIASHGTAFADGRSDS
jgi:ketosteroid isomerase-like protein